MSRRSILLTALLLTLLAGGLRFYRLAAWSYGNDETATIAETHALFGRTTAPDPHSDQLDRLAAIIPLGYVVNEIGYQMLGDADEWSVRAPMALLGTLNVTLVYLLLVPTLGPWGALGTALLVLLSPEQLFHSQNHRFYITAGIFANLTLLLGALALARGGRKPPEDNAARDLEEASGGLHPPRANTALLTCLACLAALAAIASLTTSGVLIGGLFLGMVAAALIERRPLPWLNLGIIAATGVIALAGLFLYLLPALRGWNAGETWGYGIGRSLLGAVAGMGIPMAALALPGAFSLLKERPGQGAYWLTGALLWGLCCVGFPLVIPHHPGYTFTLGLPVLVLGGWLIGSVCEKLRPQGVLVVAAWLLAVAALNAPAVLSYYQDGARHDFRAAAHYLEKHWSAGDRLASSSVGIVTHYTPAARNGLGLDPDPDRRLAQLEDAGRKSGRLWVIISGGRAGHPEPIRQWLTENCTQEVVFRKQRFDYYDYVVEVWRRRGQ